MGLTHAAAVEAEKLVERRRFVNIFCIIAWSTQTLVGIHCQGHATTHLQRARAFCMHSLNTCM